MINITNSRGACKHVGMSITITIRVDCVYRRELISLRQTYSEEKIRLKPFDLDNKPRHVDPCNGVKRNNANALSMKTLCYIFFLIPTYTEIRFPCFCLDYSGNAV